MDGRVQAKKKGLLYRSSSVLAAFGLAVGIARADPPVQQLQEITVVSMAPSPATPWSGWTCTTRSSVTLDVELSHARSKDLAGNTARMNDVAIGGILFF